MNTSKFEGHTPRPWTVSYDGEETLCWPDAIYNPETNAAIVVFEFGTGRVVEEANAALIAAAPDLLERVKVLEDALRTIAEYQHTLTADLVTVREDMQNTARDALKETP